MPFTGVDIYYTQSIEGKKILELFSQMFVDEFLVIDNK